MNAEELRRVLALVAANHPDAAPAVHKLADELRALALRLELEQERLGYDGNRSTGGMEDKVRMQVRGPDGQLKYDTEQGDAA